MTWLLTGLLIIGCLLCGLVACKIVVVIAELTKKGDQDNENQGDTSTGSTRFRSDL